MVVERYALESGGVVRVDIAEYGFFACIGREYERTAVVFGFPSLKHQFGSGYVLIFYPKICFPRAVGVAGFDISRRKSVYLSYDDAKTFAGGYGGEAWLLGWRAEAEGGLLDYVDIFFVAYTGYCAVVFNSYQQPSAAIVGKGGYAAGYLRGIGDGVFEVLVFMFALGYEFAEMVFTSYGAQVFQHGGSWVWVYSG